MSDSSENSQDSESDSSSLDSSGDEDQRDNHISCRVKRCDYEAVCPFVRTDIGLILCTICKTGVVPVPDAFRAQTCHIKKIHMHKGFVGEEFEGMKNLLTRNRTLLKRRITIPIFSIKSFRSKAVKIVVINEVLSNWFLVYYKAVHDWLCEAYTQRHRWWPAAVLDVRGCVEVRQLCMRSAAKQVIDYKTWNA